MAVTLSEFFRRIARDLHEDPASFPPGSHSLWSLDEMIGYVNYAERDFTRRTGIDKSYVSVSVPPGTDLLFNKPVGMMDIERLSFDYKRLRRVTSWDLQREDPEWRSHPNHKSRYYHEDHIPIGSFELDNRVAAGGTIRIIADFVPTSHTTDLNETIIVKDCWEQYIRWKVISLALSKDGDNQDMVRSAYADQRYMLGVSLAQRMLFATPFTVGGV